MLKTIYGTFLLRFVMLLFAEAAFTHEPVVLDVPVDSTLALLSD